VARADSHIEEEAQKAIDTFFSKHVVLPSPWTDSAKKKPFQLPGTPGEWTLWLARHIHDMFVQ